MKDKIINLVKKYITSPSLKRALKNLYYMLFDRHLFRAHKEYTFTDEKLKFSHIVEAISYARVAELPNVYFEFGCHSARTFSTAARATAYLKMKDAQLFAFDSFQGLPETNKKDDGYFESGSFFTPKNEFLRLVKRYSGLTLKPENVIKGYYEESLTPELQNRMPKVGVVHIDVDLYSSTVEVLQFIKPLLVIGTVLAFDDWYCFPPGSHKGEKLALEEFCNNNPSFKLEEWKSYSTFGKSFFVNSLP